MLRRLQLVNLLMVDMVIRPKTGRAKGMLSIVHMVVLPSDNLRKS
jgi:hypothetical protein